MRKLLFLPILLLLSCNNDNKPAELKENRTWQLVDLGKEIEAETWYSFEGSEDSFMELKLGKYIASFVTKDRSKVITAKNVNKNTYDRYFTKLNVEVPSDTIKKLLNLSYTLSKEETQYYLEKTSLSKDPQFLELRKTKEERNKR